MRHDPVLHRLLLGAGLACGLAGAAPAQDTPTTEVSFINSDGESVGTATLTGTPAGLLIALDLQGLPPDRWVGFHLHETGTCDAEGGFQSAGGHFAPEGHDHGFLSEGGPHAGDMPNQYIAADGSLRADVFNGRVSLDGGDAGVMGRALVLHGGADDYQSQPSGEAGARIACAVIE